MSMNDPIADFLTRIRNGQSPARPNDHAVVEGQGGHRRVLKDEGYIADFASATTAASRWSSA